MKLVEPRISPKPEPESETFDEEYYHSSCGPNPYERNEAWLGFFSSIVEQVIRSLSPRKVLDAGCALGMLVEAFWDRGIQADGIDVSTYAIANVRPDMREYCRVGSIADPLEGSYDLVTCIEVLEHMPAAEVEAAIRNLTAVTDTILFSSSPDDFDEPTHINVRPPLSWMQLFAQHGFWPDLTYDASFLIPHAMLFRRRAEGLSSDVLISYNERLRARCALARAEQSLRSRDATIEEMKRNAAEAEQSLRSRDATIEELKRNAAEADRSLRSRDATIEELKRNAAEADRSLRSRDTTIEELKRNAAEADATIGRMKRNATKTSQDRDRAQQALRGAKIELQRISVIETSTIWRMTSPLRTIAGHLPKTVRLYGRHAARVVWWLVTPHRIPARLRFLKNRQRLAYSATDTTYAKPADRKVLRSSQSSTKPTAAREEPSQSDASQRDLIASSSLFDAHWYLKQYSDVAAAKFDPALHYLRHGASEGRDPSALFSTRAYLDLYPSVAQSRINPLVHYERDGRKRGLTVIESERDFVKTTADMVADHYRHLAPLPTYAALEGLSRRVTVVTDSINSGSMYGGVGTAILFATLLAKRLDADLRICTIRQAPERNNVGCLFLSHGIDWTKNIDFKFVDIIAQTPPINVSPDDLFITTSWWSTKNTMQAIDPAQILYILQEDERMFYPGGDEQLRCAEVLGNHRLRFVVNTEMLYDYFASQGLSNVTTRGTWFEPSFPCNSYRFEESSREKLNFFFYARPNNVRNLFYRGVEALNTALWKGVVDPREWTFYLVGKDLEDISLPCGVRPTLLQSLRWDEYTALIRMIDLGLSLMYSPHPSYPPLDLAACGAVAVTNRFGPKQSLEAYSKNIICSELSLDAMVDSLAEGVSLAKNSTRRRDNYQAQTISRSWDQSFEPAIRWLLKE